MKNEENKEVEKKVVKKKVVQKPSNPLKGVEFDSLIENLADALDQTEKSLRKYTGRAQSVMSLGLPVGVLSLMLGFQSLSGTVFGMTFALAAYIAFHDRKKSKK